MTKSKNLTVDSFGPEMLAVLLSGAVQRREIEFETEKAAMHFRARLHTLRSTMRKTKHSQVNIVARAKVTIKGSTVIIEPQDSQFLSALSKAGVGLPALSPTSKVPKVNTLDEIDDPLAEFDKKS